MIAGASPATDSAGLCDRVGQRRNSASLCRPYGFAERGVE
jgi:hypothetical protein